jgi:hypothetical protein
MRLVMVVAIFAAISGSGCSSQNAQTAPSNGATAAISPAELAPSAASSARQPASGSDADAIRAAIEDHLRNDHGINMSVMEMSIDSVKINGDQAQANAAFHLKRGGTGMTMTYFLERHANGWLVTRNQPADGQFVHPPMNKVHSGMTPNSASQAGPGMPDVTDFLKNHAAPDSN